MAGGGIFWEKVDLQQLQDINELLNQQTFSLNNAKYGADYATGMLYFCNETYVLTAKFYIVPIKLEFTSISSPIVNNNEGITAFPCGYQLNFSN